MPSNKNMMILWPKKRRSSGGCRMNSKQSRKRLIRCLMPVWIICMIGIGCTPATKYTLPPLGEKAVLKTELLQRPELERFTPEERQAIPRTAHGKILRCLAGWWGYADVADAAVKAHEDYERQIFGGAKPK